MSRAVTYDEALVERVRDLLAARRVVEKRMFGGVAFLLDGHMAVAAGSHGGLMVRIDPADSERLLAEPGAEPMVMGGRPAMKGWLVVHSADLADPAALQVWVARGVRFAESLPPKS